MLIFDRKLSLLHLVVLISQLLVYSRLLFNVQGQNAQMQGLGQAQRALLGTIADGLAAIDDSKAQMQTAAELPPLGSDPVSFVLLVNQKIFRAARQSGT